MEFSAPKPETPVSFKDGSVKRLYIRDPPEDHEDWTVTHPEGDQVAAPVFPVTYGGENRRWTVSSTQLFRTVLEVQKYLRANHDVGLLGLTLDVIPEGHGTDRTYRIGLVDHDDVDGGFPDDG